VQERCRSPVACADRALGAVVGSPWSCSPDCLAASWPHRILVCLVPHSMYFCPEQHWSYDEFSSSSYRVLVAQLSLPPSFHYLLSLSNSRSATLPHALAAHGDERRSFLEPSHVLVIRCTAAPETPDYGVSEAVRWCRLLCLMLRIPSSPSIPPLYV